MRTITLVALAVTSTIFTTWHFMSHKKHKTRVEILPWSTVKPFQMPEIWRDTGGGLNNQILKRFVLQNVEKYNLHTEEEEKKIETTTQLNELHIFSKKEEHIVSKSIHSTTKRESCPKEPIIAAEDGGRLGNKAWEYAAVWSLSKLLNRPGYVPSSMLKYLNHVFQNLTLKTLESISHCNLNFTQPLKRYQLMPLQILPHKYSNKNLLLHKWMLLPEPTIKYRNQLRKEFKFLPNILKLVKNTFNNIKLNNKNKNITYIGVHVRRTDFKSWLPLKYNLNLINSDYVLNAMAWFRKKLKNESLLFLIVSDDPDWCKKEILSHVKDAILVSDKHTSPGQDLALLASCNHTLIDYGTFGEWGAFLSKGITVSFGVDKYFNDMASKKMKWKIWK